MLGVPGGDELEFRGYHSMSLERSQNIATEWYALVSLDLLLVSSKAVALFQNSCQSNHAFGQTSSNITE